MHRGNRLPAATLQRFARPSPSCSPCGNYRLQRSAKPRSPCSNYRLMHGPESPRTAAALNAAPTLSRSLRTNPLQSMHQRSLALCALRVVRRAAPAVRFPTDGLDSAGLFTLVATVRAPKEREMVLGSGCVVCLLPHNGGLRRRRVRDQREMVAGGVVALGSGCGVSLVRARAPPKRWPARQHQTAAAAPHLFDLISLISSL